MDVDHIPAGVDFIEYIHGQVAACDIFLAIIGPHWLGATDENGDRRIFASDDFVAIEIAAALARDIRVIPVLIDGARMPKASELPEPLMPLVRRNAFELRHSHFGRDAEALVARVREASSDNQNGIKHRLTGTVVGVGAVLLLATGGGLYVGIPTSFRWRLQPEREHSAAVIAGDLKAKAAADAEAGTKAEQAERERLAAIKTEQDRKAKAAADAEAAAKAEQAEQERLAAIKIEQDRKAKAAADAEAATKVEGERLAAFDRKAKAAANAAAEANAEAWRKFYEQQRPDAQTGAPEGTAKEAQQQFAGTTVVRLGCEAIHTARDALRFDIYPGTADGMKAIQFTAYTNGIVIEKISTQHVGDAEFTSRQSSMSIERNTASAPISLDNYSRPLSLVVVTYTVLPTGGSASSSLCLEGLR